MARYSPGGKPFISYRNKRSIIIIGLIIGFSSLLFTNWMASRLKEKEQNEMNAYHYVAMTYGIVSHEMEIFNEVKTDIPYIYTDENLNVIGYHLFPPQLLSNKKLLRRKLEKMANSGNLLIMPHIFENIYLFYDQSRLLKALYYFPYVQISIIAIFIVFSFMAFSSTKQDEQNRVWIGMAKETAHQLGTPTSSLLGWVEYLKAQEIDQGVVVEMNKDLTRLMKIVERFSKIGSVTTFVEKDITEVVENTVVYFRSRIPKNVELTYHKPETHLYAFINDALFEWVIENLLKNALDALQGKGRIVVSVIHNDKFIDINVADTGKGMTKSNAKRVFEPGFTTKTRGWGLGLSLSRRIIEENHKGRIYVLNSEVDKGTTMRVSIKSAAYSDLQPHNFFDKAARLFRRNKNNGIA